MSKMLDDDFDEDKLFSAPSAPVASPPSDTQIKIGNPLSKYFRLPGLSVTLPSRGAFFPNGGIEMDEQGQVEVLPMRGADELLLSSPDALMNNSAIFGLIQSCVPQIKMPEYVSAPDLDVLLLAIRVASTGENMDVEVECTECGEDTKFELHIPTMLQSAQTIDPINLVRINDEMVVQINPLTLAAQTKILTGAFKETRAAQAMQMNEEISDEERAIKTSAIMRNLADLNLYSVQQAVVKVTIPDSEVIDRKHIAEFIQNIDRATLKKIRDRVDELNAKGVDKSFSAECASCGHQWTATVEFDPSSFFESRSSD